MLTTFSTLEVTNGKKRFEYWHDAVCSQFVPAASRVMCREDFDAVLTTRKVGALSVSEMRAPPHFWSREHAHIRADEHDDLLLSIMLAGTGQLEQNGRSVQQRPGDIVLYDTARPFCYDLASDILLLKIPRRLLLSRVDTIANVTAIALNRNQPIGSLVIEAVRQLARMELPRHAEAATGPKLASAVLDLIAVLIDLERGEQGDMNTRQINQLERVQKYVAANLGDHDLSVERMADHGAMSARTLNRAFAKIGTTPMRWVWEQRLEASYCALAEGRAKNVTDAAMQFGFSELAHFSRSFKARFGIPPEQVLHSGKRRK